MDRAGRGGRLPRLKVVGAEFALDPRERYRDQCDHPQGGQAEGDVDIGEQSALRDDIALEKLERSERGVAAAAAVAMNQIGILREGGASGAVQAI